MHLFEVYLFIQHVLNSSDAAGRPATNGMGHGLAVYLPGFSLAGSQGYPRTVRIQPIRL